MTALEIDSRGVATLPIEGHDGTHDYTVQFAPPGLDDWACVVQRVLMGPKGEGGPHRVALTAAGSWRCSCDAWKYRKSITGPRGCKHCEAVRPLYALLQRLALVCEANI
jgi:hypothetical protein